MSGPLLHPLTAQQLDGFVGSPSHAVILAGPSGSGKRRLAISVAERVLALSPDDLADYPYQLVIAAGEATSIGIEAIRQLEHFLSLKVPLETTYNRTVIIEDSQLLTMEAQNALLKTLEEPPQGTLVILTVNHDHALLPTVRSRARSITIQRPEQSATEAYFEANGFEAAAIHQAYAISGGLPGLMQALLEEADHPLLLATQRARELLSQSAYERLLLVDELAKQRALALDIMFILQQMAHVSLQTATGATAAKWQAILNASYRAAEALQTNAQPKLALTNLLLSF